jgi:hypothetical protein
MSAGPATIALTEGSATTTRPRSSVTPRCPTCVLAQPKTSVEMASSFPMVFMVFVVFMVSILLNTTLSNRDASGDPR